MSDFSASAPRRPLELANSNTRAAIRLVPKTPPQLLGTNEENDVKNHYNNHINSIDTNSNAIYSRTPLPVHPSHFLSPAKGKGGPQGPDLKPTTPSSRGSPTNKSINTTTHQSASATAPGSSTAKPKPQPSRKKLRIHNDKTFSLLQDDSQSTQDEADAASALLVRPASKQRSSDSLSSALSNNGNLNARSRSDSIGSGSCTSALSSPVVPSTPAVQNKQQISADPISNSPWNYQFVGGLRKVAKTPDLKQKTVTRRDSPLPPLPETSDDPATVSHDLATKPSFQSTDTGTTASENTNYKVYAGSISSSEPVPPPSSSGEPNYQIIGDPSPASSIIYRPQTATSEPENYELHQDSSTSLVEYTLPEKYSHESLIVPPLRPRARRSNENFGYYKSRSRESLRTGSLTSISTVLSHQEALRAIVTSGSLIHLPPLLKQKAESASSSWANPLRLHPARSHMNEHPHQWSSQLSTVLSVSDGGTDRGSRSWSDGRVSSGFPSSNSRHSRQVLSIGSSVVQEEVSRSGSIEPPTPSYLRHGQRHYSSSSIGMVGDLDEYGDGITDMQDLRARPSRTRLSSMYNGSDNGRTNTMRSTTSSRANSLLGNSIPTWARLYYGSGERRYLGAPGSSTEGTDSRASSFRSGSPNTDHFPLSIYSPRRRPREMNARDGLGPGRGSLEITPAPQDGYAARDSHAGRFRTWSMSSLWSPHLRVDRRAARRSVWEPPSISWSTEGSMFGRRNVQIVMFIAGFALPFGMLHSRCLIH